MIRTDFTFNASLRQITFTDIIDIHLIGIIINQTDGIIIYNPMDPNLLGALSGQILTLYYNTTSMSNSDILQVFYADRPDSSLLLTADLTTISYSSAIDTTGFSSIVAQFSGSWLGKVYFETSNDGTYWDTCFIISRDEVSLQDVIDQNGTYSIKRSGKYIRYNCQKISGSAHITLVGRTQEGLSAADMLSFAMDRNNNMPLYVEQLQKFNQDPTGSLIPSDAVKPIIFTSSVASTSMTIDTTGYQSIVIQQTTAGIITPTISNDNITFVGTQGVVSTAPTVVLTATAGAGVHIFPVIAKYMKLTGPASAVIAYIYLRAIPFQVPVSNILQFGGANAVTANVSGMIAVGGNIAIGSTATAYPTPIGTVDSAGNTRRVLADTSGRILPVVTLPSQDQTYRSLSSINNTLQNGTALQVVNVEQNEGVSQVELLSLILTELKILNQLFSELPRQMNQGSSYVEEVNSYRNDPTLFT